MIDSFILNSPGTALNFHFSLVCAFRHVSTDFQPNFKIILCISQRYKSKTIAVAYSKVVGSHFTLPVWRHQEQTPCVNISPRTSRWAATNTDMRRIRTFRLTTDRTYDSGPITLWYYNIIILTIVLQLPTVFSTVTWCTGFYPRSNRLYHIN
jgi:hypothetical protein